MRSNKKLARALAGVMIGSQVLTTVPMTNVVPVFASEVNMNESTTSSKSVESTLIANAEDLGGDVVVTIPNKMTLALNSETKTLGASSEVYAKGICGVLDSLTVSVTSDKINFVNKNKATDTVEADVNFGTDNTAKWTADQLIDGLKDELALVKQPIKLETNKSSIKHVGDYQAETEFNISLGDNRNNWEAQATSLFNYKEITEGNNKGTIQITGLTDEGASYLSDEAGADGLLDIPEVIEDKAVTEIGNSAFANTNNLKTVNLPSTLKIMTKDSFYNSGTFENCTSLTSINLPEGITIYDSAFKGCTSLKEITIPKDIKTATSNGDSISGMFVNSALNKVNFTDGITSIPDNLFRDASNIQEITIPEGVETLGNSVFKNATNITTVNLPSTLKVMNKDSIFNSGTFENCTSLTSINLPEGITIYDGAFKGCTSLKEITIPKDIKTATSNGDSISGMFVNSGLNKVNFTDGITSIPNSLFRDASNIQEITIPEGVETIDDNAFANCTSLSEVNLPEGLTTISSQAFANCTSLENITIPSTVTEICSSAFKDCTSLKDVKLQEGLTKINNNAFANCTALTDITIPSTVNVDVYKVDWYGVFGGSALTTATVANGATVIPQGLFKNAANLTTVNIPEGLTTINNNAFESCTSLENITIPSSVTNMNHDSIFESCSGLTEINYGGTIEAFKASGFRTKSTSQTITVHCSDGDYTVQ